MPESILFFMQSTKIIRNYKKAHLHAILSLMSVVYWLALTLTLTLKIVYLDTTDILQLNYYIQHIGNKKLCRLCQGDHIKTYGCRYHMTT